MFIKFDLLGQLRYCNGNGVNMPKSISFLNLEEKLKIDRLKVI